MPAMRLCSIISLVSVALSSMCSLPVQADGFGINATRLIYPEGESSISTTLRNTLSNNPWLVRAVVSSAQDKQIAAPFQVIPPLFRLEPQSTNQVRIALIRDELPKDRESVFYFHATAIPASNKAGDLNPQKSINGMVQFGVGNIIKVFYRPSGLSVTPTQAQNNLQFKATAHGLEVSNPSPYFVSLDSLTVAGKKLPLSTPAAKMLVPFGSHSWPTAQMKGKVEWQTINDYGGTDAHSTILP
ncbi:pilus assembly protein PapD [Serratia oryzae]|uniref:Pilus assembly protein PapD n=2 Tax=Serratia oryzae TaxID=2034155 RepID=A0A1S8CL16_9GAMM|nr:pilus assembly protein PapD [Serratia oryzae]